MKKIRNLKEIKVIPADDQLRIHQDNNHHNIAHVRAYYKIYTNSLSTYTNVSPWYTLEDLKQLLKELRKVIRNESNKQL